MTTEKAIAANRENAKKSTGPNTQEGKAKAALNSTKHGILGKYQVLPGLERQEDWEAHKAAMMADLAPWERWRSSWLNGLG